MARLKPDKFISGKRILIIDDQEDYLTATSALLEHEGHEVVTAQNGKEGLKLLRNEHFDLLLLDFYMPGNMTGEDVVQELRKFNQNVQVILQTGYAGDYPPREMLKRLDIQGYHDKSEGPQNLLMWVDVGLKIAYTVQLLNKSRQGLNYILDITPDLHKIQPLEDLLQGVLYQISGLLGVVNSFLAVLPVDAAVQSEIVQTDSFVAMMEEEERLIIRAATGRFLDQTKISEYVETVQTDFNIKQVYEVLKMKQIKVLGNSTFVPLLVGEQALGIIYLDQCIENQQDIDLIQIFANQAAVAVQNSRLYEMATLDPLTGVYVRRIFNQWLLREVRLAFRSKQELSLLIIDMDGLKKINDTIGHLAGDQALSTLGKVLRQATRANDFVCRYGGDEFMIILPQSSIKGADIVGKRIFEFLKDKFINSPQGEILLKVSIGGVELGIADYSSQQIPHPIPYTYFDDMANKLIQEADKILYEVKHKGGNQVSFGSVIEWPAF